MSIVGKIIGVLVLLLVLLVVLAVGAYATDYAVEGTVKEKRCALTQPIVAVDTGLFGTHEVQVSPEQCSVLEEENFVVYHIRSGHTTIYEREGGRCLYDSETGYYCGGPIKAFVPTVD